MVRAVVWKSPPGAVEVQGEEIQEAGRAARR